MLSLQDFEEVKGRLRTSKRTQIKALHKFIYEWNGDRNNRQRLREFEGFEYNEEDAQYREKSAYIAANLTKPDLLCCCIILGLNYNAENLQLHIFKNLCKGNLLKDEDNEDEEGEGETEDNIQAGIEPVNNTQASGQARIQSATNAQGNMAEHESVINTETNGQPRNESVINAQASGQEDYESVYGYTRSVASVSSKRSDAENAHSRMNAYAPCFTLNFRDIEESIRPFDGSGKIPIETWIEDFKEVAQLMQWNDFQMLIYAKKSLRGLAKLFVMGEKSLNSWTKLHDALLDEFGMKMNNEHNMLCQRKMKFNESLQEYLYHMKDLAAQGNIEEAALIQYIIDGIQESNTNKAILYGAHSMKEFKQKLSTYELFINHQKVQSTGAVKKHYNERPQNRKVVTEAQQQTKARALFHKTTSFAK